MRIVDEQLAVVDGTHVRDHGLLEFEHEYRPIPRYAILVNDHSNFTYQFGFKEGVIR